MKKLVFTPFLLVLAASSCATNGNEVPNITSSNQNIAAVTNTATPEKPKFDASKIVGLAIEKTEIKTGGANEAEIKLEIQKPYHVNSNPPSEKSFIPLEVSLENGDGITAGKTIYPKGELKKFAFSGGKSLSVYSGEIVVKLPLKADKGVSTGQHTLHGTLKFQPCDEEVCYRPQTINLELPITVN